jgi:signal transduction histidine kinase
MGLRGASRRAASIAALALLYYAGARVGLALSYEQTNVSPVWPPSGIALAGVLIAGYGVWPGITAGAFLANLLNFRGHGFPWDTALAASAGLATGNTLEALLGAFLLMRVVGPRNPLDRAVDVLRFAGLAGVACALDAVNGASVLWAAGVAPRAEWATLWWTWATGDLMGILTVTPVALAWSRARPRADAVATAVVVLLLGASLIAFGLWSPTGTNYPAVYLPLPFLVWAAFRLGTPGATAGVALVSAVAVAGTTRGVGPFAVGSLNESLLLLQTFMGLVTMMILVLCADLSERHRAAEQLRRAHKLEAVGRLAAGVAHDFGNLVTVIKGLTETALMRLNPPGPQRENLQEVVRACDHAGALTRQLIAFGGRQVLNPRPLDLGALLEQESALVRQALGERIEFALIRNGPAGPVQADPDQIRQVVLNLVVNARDAMPEGGRLTLEVGVVELRPAEAETVDAAPGPYVRLAVRDTGGGMEAETQARAFEPFFTTKESGKGGLGLATVYGIVTQSGGVVSLDSQPGKGTTVTIYLPLS